MNLDDAETRLGQERAYLIRAQHDGRVSLITLAESHVAHWEEVVRTKQLEDAGGWTP